MYIHIYIHVYAHVHLNLYLHHNKFKVRPNTYTKSDLNGVIRLHGFNVFS